MVFWVSLQMECNFYGLGGPKNMILQSGQLAILIEEN